MTADGPEPSPSSSASRRATNDLLAPLRAAGFPAGALAFARSTLGRSVQQAALHPRALAELSALHVVFALAADGRLARAEGPTRFGAAADVVADTATWTWWAFTADPSRIMRVATLAAWVGPVLAVSVAGFRRGEMVDLARPRWLRPGGGDGGRVHVPFAAPKDRRRPA